MPNDLMPGAMSHACVGMPSLGKHLPVPRGRRHAHASVRHGTRRVERGIPRIRPFVIPPLKRYNLVPGGCPMSKANVDPAELRRFAHDLNRFNTELQTL